MSPPKPIGVGIVGYGFSTRTFHLPFILPNPSYRLVAFVQRHDAAVDSRTGKTAPHCTIDYPEARRYKGHEEFLADSEVELVIIATGHSSHAALAIAALKAGKHVIVEKPFCCSSQEADQVIAQAKKSGKVLTVFQNRRYDSDFRTLQSLVDQNVLGQITEAEIHYDVDFPPWASGNPGPDFKPGGGLMFGIGCHVLDQALALFGQPASVTGFYRSLVHPSKSDNAFTIVLQYDPSGPQKDLLVTVKGSIVSNLVYPLKYFVRGFDGTFIKHGEDPQEPQIVAQGMTSTDPKFGYEDPDTYGMLTTSKKAHDSQQEKKGKWVGTVPSLNGDYMGYYEDVAKAIRGEKELVVKPETSRDGIRIIELARESADSGRTLSFA